MEARQGKAAHEGEGSNRAAQEGARDASARARCLSPQTSKEPTTRHKCCNQIHRPRRLLAPAACPTLKHFCTGNARYDFIDSVCKQQLFYFRSTYHLLFALSVQHCLASNTPTTLTIESLTSWPATYTTLTSASLRCLSSSRLFASLVGARTPLPPLPPLATTNMSPAQGVVETGSSTAEWKEQQRRQQRQQQQRNLQHQRAGK